MGIGYGSRIEYILRFYFYLVIVCRMCHYEKKDVLSGDLRRTAPPCHTIAVGDVRSLLFSSHDHQTRPADDEAGLP